MLSLQVLIGLILFPFPLNQELTQGSHKFATHVHVELTNIYHIEKNGNKNSVS